MTLDDLIAGIDDLEPDEAWSLLTDRLAELPSSAPLARALACKAVEGSAPPEELAPVHDALLDAWPDDARVLGWLTVAWTRREEGGSLNLPPTTNRRYVDVTERLVRHVDDLEAAPWLVHEAACAVRRLGVERTDEAVALFRRVLDADPDDAAAWFDLGLCLKESGRFAEAAQANARALELSDEPSAAVFWNLGICATAAGEDQVALGAWRALGMELETGQDGRPAFVGSGPACKVRLCERPRAVRAARGLADDPGSTETVWIRRLSPCHGALIVPTMGDFDIDMGDLVMHDGAAITIHTIGEQRVPVFPLLDKLADGGWRVFRFVGEQSDRGQLAALDGDWEDGARLYVLTEQVRILCAACADDPDAGDRCDHQPPVSPVRGKLAVPPDVPLEEIRDRLDEALADCSGAAVHCPGLLRELGDELGSRRAERRNEELECG